MSTLSGFVAAYIYIYLIKKWIFIEQLLYIVLAKQKSVFYSFIKVPCPAYPLS